MLSGEKGRAEARRDIHWGAVLGIPVVQLDTLIISFKIRCDLLILCGVVRADNVSSRRIRLAAYVTRLERVRGSRPSWVQIPHPPPLGNSLDIIIQGIFLFLLVNSRYH